jgi:hypothetical protein
MQDAGGRGGVGSWGKLADAEEVAAGSQDKIDTNHPTGHLPTMGGA